MNLQELKKMNQINLMVAKYRVMLLKLYIEAGYYDDAEFDKKVSQYKAKLEKGL
jgi:hypothetical protein